MTITITFKDDRKYRHFNSRYMIFESIRFIDIFQDAIEGKQERKTIHYNLDEIKKIEFIEPEPKKEKIMAKLPNRLVIEISNTDKVDELGNPVVAFESKDYAECVIEELEKIKAEIECNMRKNNCDLYGYADSLVIIDKHIAELKGETE